MSDCYCEMKDVSDAPCDGLIKLREQLAAERARADYWKGMADKMREMHNGCGVFDKAVTADRDRLRAAVEQAPHSPNCPTGVFGSGGTPRCSCWKRAALDTK